MLTLKDTMTTQLTNSDIRTESNPAAYASFDDVFESMRYPAGESHVSLRPGIDPATLTVIEATARSFDDLAQIVTADRILRSIDPTASVEWFVPYFPFARHDRRNHAGDGFELAFALEMVSELRIVVADPHSDVAGQLRHIDQAAVVAAFSRAGLFDNDPIIVIPDAGAAKKTYTWTGEDSTVIQALKRRDPATGELSGFHVLTDEFDNDLGGRPCIIVDDICDGGGTFLGLAAELETVNAGPLTLAVTHGLFTKGLADLANAFDTIASFGSCNSAAAHSGRVLTIPFNGLYTKGTIT